MNIMLNGQNSVFEGKTLADLVAQQQPAAPFAIALNTAFVAKSLYAETVLQEGDKVEMVCPVVGG